MAKDGKQNTKPTPSVPDPYDMQAKRQIHPQADEINFIEIRSSNPLLCCGARKKKGPGNCRSIAGAGTDHVGYGRCKFCGGASTGPTTAEGKAASAVNARKHGFYSKVLDPLERQTYETLLEAKTVSLMDEIFMLKAKILTYLDKWNRRQHEEYKTWRGEKKRRGNKVTYKDGEEVAYYHAGTADDRALQRALETLRRLVDSHAKLTQGTGDDLLSTINSELRAASQGQVTLAWGSRPAQGRKEGSENG